MKMVNDHKTKVIIIYKIRHLRLRSVESKNQYFSQNLHKKYFLNAKLRMLEL